MSGLRELVALTPLIILLLVIAKQDIRIHRISNKLVLIGMCFGVAVNSVPPMVWNVDSAISGGLGFGSALQGFAIGIVIFLPLYLIRAMGAGDVKLMAMVGTFLGPGDVLGAALSTLIAGGVMALVAVIYSGNLAKSLQNVKLILLGGLIETNVRQRDLVTAVPKSVGKLPYAVAVAAGTLGYLIWQHIY